MCADSRFGGRWFVPLVPSKSYHSAAVNGTFWGIAYGISVTGIKETASLTACIYGHKIFNVFFERDAKNDLFYGMTDYSLSAFLVKAISANRQEGPERMPSMKRCKVGKSGLRGEDDRR